MVPQHHHTQTSTSLSGTPEYYELHFGVMNTRGHNICMFKATLGTFIGTVQPVDDTLMEVSAVPQAQNSEHV